MSIEERVSKLEMQMKNLQQAYLDMQKRQVNTVGRIDDTSNRVTAITPYTSTKIGHYGDTEMNFYEVPQGNVEVFFNGENRACTLARVENRLTVKFGALTDRTNITIIVK